MIRLASGSGYWGDWRPAPALQIQSGPVDYLVLDYLAEVTLAILSRQKLRDPDLGYATDFVEDIGDLLTQIREQKVCVVSNAGGTNPEACAHSLLEKARRKGIAPLKIGVVSGDDITDLLKSCDSSCEPEPLSDEFPPFEEVKNRIAVAHAYIGAEPIVEVLNEDPDIVITGRCSDPSLFVAPMIHEFGIAFDDWNALALGTVVGHVLECGGQASGGNFLGGWKQVPDLERLGFPIAEMQTKSSAVITKHSSLGGLVSQETIKEQLVYEIGDPQRYITPDCVADFTTIQLRDDGPNRVIVSGVQGKPKTDNLKVAAYFEKGWQVVGHIVYTWPEAVEKAEAAASLVKKRAEGKVGDAVIGWTTEILGAGACHHGIGPQVSDPPEVVLRVTASAESRDICEAIADEWAPLILTGPPGATGYASGRPKPRRVFAYWGGLIRRGLVQHRTEVMEL